ncbi:MAG: flagellar basal body L-ring protein FlgH [Terriglobales bacterium]
MARVKRCGNALALLLLALSLAALAQKPHAAAHLTPAQQALQAYLAKVRQVAGATSASTGSLWTPEGRFINLASDFKAQRVNDLITINIVESTQAAGTGTVQSKRGFTGNSGIAVFGSTSSRLSTLIAPTSNTDLEGQASTASSSQLTTSLTGRVVDVLPNGFLVVQAVRTIAMNEQQQTVIVNGVVRPADIAPDNSVLSTQVGELEVDLVGKGILSDTTRPVTSWLRFLLKFLSF